MSGAGTARRGTAGLWFKRFMPRSLAGQTIALVLLTLVIAFVSGFVILAEERHSAIRAEARLQLAGNIELAHRLLAATPPAARDGVLQACRYRYLTFRLAKYPAVVRQNGAGKWFRDRLGKALALPANALLVSGDDAQPWYMPRWWHDHATSERLIGSPRDRRSFTVSVALPDGEWLNVDFDRRWGRQGWAWAPVAVLLTAMIASIGFCAFLVRRITRPLARLTQTAKRFVHSEAGPPVPETGPEEIRQAAGAFNRMSDRLTRYVEDRTRLLAAMAHDLRTPLTTLRLRAELIDDMELRDKFNETLDEMQAMTEASLDFARESATREDTRAVELNALVASLCDDLRDAGAAVGFKGSAATPYPCRPVALKRAVTNLVKNAVEHGGGARVGLERTADGVRITVEDDGPGIPPDALARVFEPFDRVDGARGSESGGMRLGLAIAKSIARSHGGDVILENRPQGGLTATVRLPART